MPMLYPIATTKTEHIRESNLTKDPFHFFKKLDFKETTTIKPSTPGFDTHSLTRVDLDTSWLSPRQKDCLEELTKAGNAIDTLFWRQMTPHGFEIKEMLERALPYIKDESLKQNVLEYYQFLIMNHGYYNATKADTKFTPPFSQDEFLLALSPLKAKSKPEKKELEALRLEFWLLSDEMYSNYSEKKPDGAEFYPKNLTAADIDFAVALKQISKKNKMFERISNLLEKSVARFEESDESEGKLIVSLLRQLAKSAKARTASGFEKEIKRINTLVRGDRKGKADVIMRSQLQDGNEAIRVEKRDRWKLKAVPFEKEYKQTLKIATGHMLSAAKIIEPEDAEFAAYLRKRAKAMLSGKKSDFDASDIAWICLNSSAINFVGGPVETYEDELLGLKASYHAYLAIKNKAATEKAQKFKEFMPRFIRALPCDEKYKNKNVRPPEIDFVDAVLIAGHPHGTATAIAFSLPNDPKIKEKYGSRLTQTVNLTEAKVARMPVRNVILESFIDQDAASKFTSKEMTEGYILRIMFHEYSHPLGLSLNEKGEVVNPRDVLGEFQSPFEELKANVIGINCTLVAFQNGEITKRELEAACLDVVLDGLTWAFKQREPKIAHAKAGLMEFNYLFEKGAITLTNGKYAMDFNKILDAERDLAEKLLLINGKGDKQAAKEFIEKYAKIPEHMIEMLGVLDSLNLPKFIYPVLSEI
ncbi:MAG: hypothetical protein AB1468_01140 [Candidatus Micrarchaeota archaeon]